MIGEHRYGPEPEHLLDIQRPSARGAADAGGAARAAPLAIVVHGGAWRTGDRSLARTAQHGLADRAVIAAAIEYRMRPADPVADMVADIRSAVTWLLANPEAVGSGWDGRVMLVGDSAGGHAALVAALEDERIDRVAALCGALSLEALRHPVGEDQVRRFAEYRRTICGSADAAETPLGRWDPVCLRRERGAVAPPLFAATSTGDFFSASTLDYCARADEWGDPVTVHQPRRALTHSWHLDAGLPETAALFDALAAWLRAPAARVSGR